MEDKVRRVRKSEVLKLLHKEGRWTGYVVGWRTAPEKVAQFSRPVTVSTIEQLNQVIKDCERDLM